MWAEIVHHTFLPLDVYNKIVGYIHISSNKWWKVRKSLILTIEFKHKYRNTELKLSFIAIIITQELLINSEVRSDTLMQLWMKLGSESDR